MSLGRTGLLHHVSFNLLVFQIGTKSVKRLKSSSKGQLDEIFLASLTSVTFTSSEVARSRTTEHNTGIKILFI